MTKEQRRKFAKKIVDGCETSVRLFNYTRPEACKSQMGNPDNRDWSIKFERRCYTVSIDGFELDFHLTDRGPRFYAEFDPKRTIIDQP